MNKKNWLVRTYDENDNVLTVQLLKGLTMEEAYVESAAIVAAGKPTPRITKNYQELARQGVR
jgi:hypothetical protein